MKTIFFFPFTFWQLSFDHKLSQIGSNAWVWQTSHYKSFLVHFESFSILDNFSSPPPPFFSFVLRRLERAIIDKLDFAILFELVNGQSILKPVRSNSFG